MCIERGFVDITAIDISPTLINEMQKKYVHLTGVEFVVMDVREMSRFPDGVFTLVIDKGCLDALFCATDFKDSCARAMREMYRVTRMNGLAVSFSHAPLLARVPYFRVVDWAIEGSPAVGGGENICMISLTKTTSQVMIDRKVVGAEAGVPIKKSHLVQHTDQKMNKTSTTRNAANTGSMTVTASVDMLSEMVEESEQIDD